MIRACRTTCLRTTQPPAWGGELERNKNTFAPSLLLSTSHRAITGQHVMQALCKLSSYQARHNLACIANLTNLKLSTSRKINFVIEPASHDTAGMIPDFIHDHVELSGYLRNNASKAERNRYLARSTLFILQT